MTARQEHCYRAAMALRVYNMAYNFIQYNSASRALLSCRHSPMVKWTTSPHDSDDASGRRHGGGGRTIDYGVTAQGWP